MRRDVALAALLLLAARRAEAAPPEDFPCAGCVVQAPAPAGPGAPASRPRPLLVALHGDGAGVGKLVRAWKGAAADADVILLAPRCPVALGCTSGSWWQWLQLGTHDPDWLNAQIEAVAARYPVDRARVYATGYSGGATYLGWYVPAHPTRFAAVAHVAGGAPYGGACPACKVPLLFLIGSLDPMIEPYTMPLRRYYEACGGHELVWETLRGTTHEGILDVLQAGRAKETLAWLLARPAACVEAADAGVPDAGDGGAGKDAGAAVVTAATDARAPVEVRPPRAPPVAGCACGHGERAGGGAALTPALLGAMLLRRRRRGRAVVPADPPRARVTRTRPPSPRTTPAARRRARSSP
jgi:poly(3-hydroxybutyrate) depolymerase